MTIVKDIILTQKREFDRFLKERYIDRNNDFKIHNDLNNDLIKVIIGPRRAGKSFFALHQMRNIKSGYVNFDDERLIDVSDYDEITESIKSVYGDVEFLFFDEIQNISNWELYINRLKRIGYKIILTGSNSNLLSKELSTHLTGRYLQYVILPFSFNEYINIFSETDELTETEKKHLLSKYLNNGGYPETCLKELDTNQYLKTLSEAVIYKDIVIRYNIREAKNIESLFNFIIANPGIKTSYNKLKNNLNFNSVNTVKSYLEYIENSFLIFTVNKFSFKVKEQINSPKKIYVIDNGLLRNKSINFSSNLGKLYENLVAIELKKLELTGEINLYYYHNTQKYETDFVVQKNNKIVELIQVCYDLDKDITEKREIRGLIHASQDLNCKNLTVLSFNREEKRTIEWYDKKYSLNFIPIYKWLLKKEKYSN